MFFKKGKFFLELTGEEADAKDGVKVVVAPVAAPAPKSTPAAKSAEAAAPVTVAAVAPVTTKAEPAPVAASSGVRTTAEEIAAELAAAQANRPAASTVTFAPDRLVPGGTLPLRRRSAGANLAGFRDIARSMMKS